MNRRSLLTATVATTALPLPVATAPHRVGASDVTRLRGKFADVVAGDHQHGGIRGIESRALDLSAEAVDLQGRGSTSQRVRSQLYAVAAAFTSSAMWAAIDGRRFDAARHHHERAASLAAMSGDQTIQFRIWSHAGSLYRHMGRPSDALAANDVARALPVTRRDPLFAALGHARHAAIHGLAGNRSAVERTIGHAQDAADRADPHAHRPVWMTAVCDQAELAELALSAYLSLGDFERAEAQAHRSLTLLRPSMQRDRALVTAPLAQAQLGQEEVEPAMATAMGVPLNVVRHPRVAGILAAFGSGLREFSPHSSHTRAWTQYQREVLT